MGCLRDCCDPRSGSPDPKSICVVLQQPYKLCAVALQKGIDEGAEVAMSLLQASRPI